MASSRDKNNSLQIFLGGSCNPTTWRQNVAIPFLELNGISYYNPQVDNWTPELVNTERHAKQSAQVLLFVIDGQTRSTVSIIESAFMAGEDKNLVLVIYPFGCDLVSVKDSSKQMSSIIETRSTLLRTSISTGKSHNSQSSVVTSSSSSSSSTKSSSTIISNSSSISGSHLASSTTNSCTTSALKETHLHRMTDLEKREKVSQSSVAATCEKEEEAVSTVKMCGESISFAEFQELKQARYILQNLVTTRHKPMFFDILTALKHVTCCLNDNSGKESDSCRLGTLSESKILLTMNSQVELGSEQVPKDVYLSLDGGDQVDIDSLVIQSLEDRGLTYNYLSMDSILNSNSSLDSSQVALSKFTIDHHNSTITDLNRYSNTSYFGEKTRLALDKEICAIRSSRVLLFVITNKCRGLPIMVLASHFMALFRNNIVLCVQYLEEPCSIGGESLTKTAIADYNRGRVYLCDYAVKSQVPVFSTIQEAIECCSRKCRSNNKD